jgi:hypothetical protein
MSKSFVTMESKVCMTCGCEYSTGTILLDKRMQNRFERDTLTGWGLCDQHAQAAKEGLIALIEVDPDKSTPGRDGKLMPDEAYRTGRVVLIKREVLQRALVNIDIPKDCPFMFIDIQAFNKMLPPEDLANAPEESDRSTAGNVAPGSSRVN